MDRVALIGELRAQKKTYKEIGVQLGITKQRVHQLYKDKPASLPKNVRREVNWRDGRKCSACGVGGKVDIHHIDGDRRNNNLDNLITLCKKHHMEIEVEMRREREKEPKFFHLIVPRIIRNCKKCGKPMELTPSAKEQFCSRKCYAETRILYPEEVILQHTDMKAFYRMRMKRYYTQHKDDPRFREIKRRHNQRQRESGYTKNYYEKNRDKILAKARENNKIRYATDPVYREKSKATSLTYYLKNKKRLNKKRVEARKNETSHQPR